MQSLRIQGYIEDVCVTLDAKLSDAAAFKHLRILRSMRRVARRTSLKLERSMFENERTLLVGVAFHAGLVGSDGELGLFLIEAAVRVVTIAAAHCPFQHLVSERFGELRFDLAVA